MIDPVYLTITSSVLDVPKIPPLPHWKSIFGTLVVSIGEAPCGI